MSRYYDREDQWDRDMSGDRNRRGDSSPYWEGPPGLGEAGGDSSNRQDEYDRRDNDRPRDHHSHDHRRHGSPSLRGRDPDDLMLAPPNYHNRPRSVPPPHDALISRHDPYLDHYQPRYADDWSRERDQPRPRPRGRDRDRDKEREKPKNPLEEARQVFDRTFSQTTSGLGVSLIGAVVGGLAAHEASHAAIRTRSKKDLDKAVKDPNGPVYHPPHPLARRSSSTGKREADKTRHMATVAGALVGGLGANAIEKRFEAGRQKTKKEQAAWERKWGHDEEEEEEDYYYRKDYNRKDDYDRGRRRRDDDRWGDDPYWQDDNRRPIRQPPGDDRYYRW